MVIAWSRISSKVITHPPEAAEACRRRCENWKGRSSTFIPQMVDKRKQEGTGGRVTQRALHSHRREGACVTCTWTDGHPTDPHATKERHHVSHTTTGQKTGQSQTAPLSQSARTPRARLPPGATRCRGSPAGPRGPGAS